MAASSSSAAASSAATLASSTSPEHGPCPAELKAEYKAFAKKVVDHINKILDGSPHMLRPDRRSYHRALTWRNLFNGAELESFLGKVHEEIEALLARSSSSSSSLSASGGDEGLQFSPETPTRHDMLSPVEGWAYRQFDRSRISKIDRLFCRNRELRTRTYCGSEESCFEGARPNPAHSLHIDPAYCEVVPSLRAAVQNRYDNKLQSARDLFEEIFVNGYTDQYGLEDNRLLSLRIEKTFSAWAKSVDTVLPASLRDGWMLNDHHSHRQVKEARRARSP